MLASTTSKEGSLEKLLVKEGAFLWPPISPDLTVIDLFSQGHIKQKVWNVP